MGLSFLDAVAGNSAFGTQVLGFLLHLTMPHVLVKLTDVHEDADVRDRLKLRRAWLPHVSRERGHREEELRIGGCDVERGDPSVRWTGDMKLATFDLVVGEYGLQEIGKNARAILEKELTFGRRRRNH